MRNKLSELILLVSDRKPDIICVTETHFAVEYCDAEVSIPNYDVFRADRNIYGGGSIIYVNSRLLAIRMESFCVTDCLGVSFETIKGKIHVVCVYRSTSLTEDENQALIDELNTLPVNDSSEVIIVGDFNLPNVNWKSGCVEAPDNTTDRNLRNQMNYLDFFIRKGLSWHIKDTITRRRLVNDYLQESILDQLLTTNMSMIVSIKTLAPLGRSDHVVIESILQINNDANYISSRKRNWSKCDRSKVKSMGENTNWFFNGEEDDIEGMWDDLCSKINVIIDTCTPIITNKTVNGIEFRKMPWECSKLKRLRKEKNRSWKEFENQPTTINFKYAMDYQQSFEFTEGVLKRNYERKLAKNIKTNSKGFFSYVRSKRKVNERLGSLIDTSTNTKTTTPKETADLLAEYFASVFKEEPQGPLRKECYGTVSGMSQIGNIQVNDQDVFLLLNDLNIYKSHGPDEIHPSILKELCGNRLFTSAVTKLYKCCAKYGKIPETWKQAVVIPLFKKGSKLNVNNYRPVSLTCILCKVYEKLLRKHILQHVSEQVSSSQHGFVQGKSCLSNLLETVEAVANYLDSGRDADIVYLDFCKAFDSVPHSRLLVKLQSFGITGNTLAIIKDFLSNRWMTIKVGDSYSERKRVVSGVPQGSVIGPLLFVLFINDLPDSVKSFARLYADDLKLVGDANSSEILENDLKSLSIWESDWGMNFNPEKCSVIHIGKDNPRKDYYFNGNVLNTVENEKDLGVLLTESFTWNEQIQECIGKAKQMTSWILRNILSRDADVLLPIYKSLIRPHLEYCVQVWAPRPRHGNWRIIMELENCQRKFTKVIKGFEQLSYKERIEKLGLTTLLERRTRGDLIEMFKIRNNYVSYGQDMFQTGRSGRRLLLQPQANTTLYQDLFKCRSVAYWNRLPLSVRTASSVTNFKILLDKHKDEAMSRGIMNGFWELSEYIFSRL